MIGTFIFDYFRIVDDTYHIIHVQSRGDDSSALRALAREYAVSMTPKNCRLLPVGVIAGAGSHNQAVRLTNEFDLDFAIGAILRGVLRLVF